MRILSILSVIVVAGTLTARAQVPMRQVDPNGNISQIDRNRNHTDSLGSDKEIPKGIKVWTVDTRFGDITRAMPDTLPHMYPNSIFTTGIRGEYNTTGNLGAARQSRIFIDRSESDAFLFTRPYDYFITDPATFRFTNTLSPITNLSYNNAGNRTNGEDHFTARFGVNAGKKIGVGFKFDYLYGRGYYSNQSSSHFNYTMYGSYMGDRYQAHLLLSTNHQKVAENGGITNDMYITNPETFDDNYATSEIPTVLERNWNRNDNQHVFLTHRYSLGFNRKVPMTDEEIKAKRFAMASQKENAEKKAMERARKKAEKAGEDFDEEEYKARQVAAGRPDGAKIAGREPDKAEADKGERIKVDGKAAADSLLASDAKAPQDTSWTKDEYVPVTSFIHTMRLDHYRRIYQAYVTPADYYLNTYPMQERFTGDSIYDKTSMLRLQNTFAVSLLEGFNKWAKAGLKVFATHELRRMVLPDAQGTAAYNEQRLSVGAQLAKAQGSTLHYHATGELGVAGRDMGFIKIDGAADLNFRLLGDTVTLAASGFFHRTEPDFYYRHYHARHFLWDNDDLKKTTHTRVEGRFSYKKTRTTLRVAVDGLTNYTYLGTSYNITDDFGRTANTVAVRQSGDFVSVLTAQLSQDFTLGPLHWESVLSYQKSTKQEVLPLPALNVYTNLYLRFKIARVLACDFGADARYFTSYEAPDYSAALGQYAVQENAQKVEIGNYPIVNVYANFHLQRTRFFVMYSHVNAGSGNKRYFMVPHHPLNERVLRLGVSWNFFN